MYGISNFATSELFNKVIDYDLRSAYTTGMALLGHPDYAGLEYINSLEDLKGKEDSFFIKNYIVLECTFKFPEDVKFPCIPCTLDENASIYPLKGSSVITGLEYLTAQKMGCEFSFARGVRVPFGKSAADDDDGKYLKPFRDIFSDLQSKRREYPKDSFLNQMYKEIGNSIYGQVAKGIGRKNTYDIKSGGMVAVSGGILSNPLLASYITSFIRSVVSECLHNISYRLKGKLISVTTDGFLTDVEDLENKLLSLPEDVTPLIRMYKELVVDLSNGSVNESLEIKHIETGGIISITTRVQVGFTSHLKAITGFQSKELPKAALLEMFEENIRSTDKFIYFIQNSLRSAIDIFKHGGHVVAKYSDRQFKFAYDNRRRIIDDHDP
jgi:hypothetical protein